MTQAEVLIFKENEKDILSYSNQGLKKDTTQALFLKILPKDRFKWNKYYLRTKKIQEYQNWLKNIVTVQAKCIELSFFLNVYRISVQMESFCCCCCYFLK